MTFLRAGGVLALLLAVARAADPRPLPDWPAVEAETLQHFQAIVRMDTSDPPGGEKPVADYLREVLTAEGIEVKVFALDPNRPNVVARLRGTGKKPPLLLMAHTDTVNIDPKKWTHPPFSAHREDGFIYGRGTVDDKDNVAINLMTMLLLKRSGVPLDRDVIFLAEAGEEGSVQFGIEFMVEKHFDEIAAEFCLAEGGGVRRTGGKVQYGSVQTTEKIPNRLRLVARGVAGHGSVPLRSNAVVHLAKAIAAVADWRTEMRLNETTRAFFERLAAISPPEEAVRYQSILQGDESGAAQEYFAVNVPFYNSMIRTSISPNIITGGYRVNVIPSEVEATLDVRALPDEDMAAFLEQMTKVINDPAIEIQRAPGHSRPGAPPSRLNTEAFEAIEAGIRRHYGVITLPTMSTGATDMAYLRQKGIQCFGIGPMIDSEDGPRGFGAHSDQERILEEALHLFLKFNWDVVLDLAAARP
ncbi:putative succinyl-diaminopimelate desuccinylase [Lacunisphaera limnophila]|uniref:Putative succinyl-diaminopimelate desuccinylase n=1 Tax=Lacunisphaera limnophila TaxID=1838286 RepID=A0A1I7PHH3_9BACT|nr:M20/M25/M40 family metallo-hydrolase [Lacunisphaera limnophila]AOS43055.1 putative succinyl-diaminopimelate desuccinylase [Lacunisphaera limnophila]